MDLAPLAGLSLFAGVDEGQLKDFADRAQDIDVEIGTVLVNKGDLAYKFFVILDGLAAVTGDAEQLASLGAGDFFGETGLVDEAKRNANVVAITPMRVAALLAWDFRDAMDSMPAVADSISRAAAERR